MAWLRILVLAGAALSLGACGDDDYNGDAGSAVTINLSVAVDEGTHDDLGVQLDLTVAHDLSTTD